MLNIIGTVVNLILDVVAVIVGGITFMYLWQWFAVPAFGVAAVGFGLSCGLVCLIGLASPGSHTKYKELDDMSYLEVCLKGAYKCFAVDVVRPLTFLLTGWIVTLFI